MELQVPSNLQRSRMVAEKGCQSHQFHFVDGCKKGMIIFAERLVGKESLAVLCERTDEPLATGSVFQQLPFLDDAFESVTDRDLSFFRTVI